MGIVAIVIVLSVYALAIILLWWWMFGKNKLRVVWKSKITGYCGHGKRLFAKEEIRDICNMINISWPEINHWWKN